MYGLIKYGVIVPTKSDDMYWDSSGRDGGRDVGVTGSPKKRPSLLEKKSVLMNTPQSDMTSDPKDEEIDPPKDGSTDEDPEDEEFITVTNKKGRHNSSGSLAKLRTDMKFPATDVNKRKTRNSMKLESTDVELDSDFHKAESA